MVEYDAESLTDREIARIVKSAVTPRPIAWISTVSEDRVDNLAPFSSYNYVSSSQPVVTFHSPNEANGGLKDTARNAVDTGEFAVNVVTEPLMEAMDHTSASLPPEESEFDLAELERADCTTIDAPRVAAAPVTMECTLHDTHEVFDRLMVLGEVRHFHVSEAVITDGKVDQRKLPTVGRLGGPYYTVSEPVEFERQF
ncbi:flavin reductase family protein [Salinirubellus sp. GCM10025818]|uniref:flavin reductase family protein n=1 Tax=Salinirubellus TaxID=2162630 RepID=UPI0030CBCF07